MERNNQRVYSDDRKRSPGAFAPKGFWNHRTARACFADSSRPAGPGDTQSLPDWSPPSMTGPPVRLPSTRSITIPAARSMDESAVFGRLGSTGLRRNASRNHIDYPGVSFVTLREQFNRSRCHRVTTIQQHPKTWQTRPDRRHRAAAGSADTGLTAAQPNGQCAYLLDHWCAPFRRDRDQQDDLGWLVRSILWSLKADSAPSARISMATISVSSQSRARTGTI